MAAFLLTISGYQTCIVCTYLIFADPVFNKYFLKKALARQPNCLDLHITIKQHNMTTSVEMTILSHLSDAQIEISINPELARNRMRFVRLLIFNYPDTTVKITTDELDELWSSMFK